MAIVAMLKKMATIRTVIFVQGVICLSALLYGTYEVATYNRLLSQMHFYEQSLCSAYPDHYMAAQVKGTMRCLNRSDALEWKHVNLGTEAALVAFFAVLLVPGLIRRDFSSWLD